MMVRWPCSRETEDRFCCFSGTEGPWRRTRWDLVLDVSAKRFRIACSFAGEKRDCVERIAALLARQFGENAILYDGYHQPELSRSDAAFYLPDLYEKEADLIVVVLCPDYEKKEWCGLEWNAVF